MVVDPPVGPEIVAELIELVKDAGTGQLTVLAFVRRLFDLAAKTGIEAAILSDYLTESGKRYAEAAADIAEEAKLRVIEMKKGL